MLLFKDFRPLAAELTTHVGGRSRNSAQMISSTMKYVRDDTLRSAAELIEWKTHLTHAEIAQILRKLADGTHI